MLIATGFDDEDDNHDDDYQDVPQLWTKKMREQYLYEVQEWRLSSGPFFTVEEVLAEVKQIIGDEDWEGDED
jgi:hypothetical protein